MKALEFQRLHKVELCHFPLFSALLQKRQKGRVYALPFVFLHKYVCGDYLSILLHSYNITEIANIISAIQLYIILTSQ